MADISATLEAKSDQLNATDIIGAEPVIRVRAVELKQSAEQPTWVYFDGDNNRPWKPSKGMRRILAAAWGRDSDAWLGKHAQLMFESSVIYAGKEVGGIRIKALSDIPAAGLNCALTISRTKREAYHVPLLKVQSKAYPADKFEAALPAMAKAMAEGKMTLPQVVAQCQKTGQLTPEQLAQLEAAAPVEVNHDDDDDEVFR
jgi:hypothetical protein